MRQVHWENAVTTEIVACWSNGPSLEADELTGDDEIIFYPKTATIYIFLFLWPFFGKSSSDDKLTLELGVKDVLLKNYTILCKLCLELFNELDLVLDVRIIEKR